ncbi:hypothetical protein AB1E18_001672 [Capra hircus]
MAGLNVSLCFFLATFALCQAVRRAAKALLPGGTYAHFAREVAGTAQLGACCLEMRMLVELGPWALGFGPDLLLTLVFLLLLVHGATLDGASANPTVSLQRFLLAEASLPSTLLELVAQALGVQAAGALTRLYWAWGLSDLHLLQSLMDPHCSSALRTAAPHGALLEGSCAFLLHLALLRLQGSRAVHRAPAVALLLTAVAGTAGPLTSAFLNPTLAASVTFRCSGHSLLEYIQVYWLGPVTGKTEEERPRSRVSTAGLEETTGGLSQCWRLAGLDAAQRLLRRGLLGTARAVAGARSCRATGHPAPPSPCTLPP